MRSPMSLRLWARSGLGVAHDEWRVENTYLHGQLIFHAAAFLETFKDYPPSQRPASFSIDQIRKNMDKVIDKSFKDRGIEK